jgi:hypothetical protein
MATKVFNSAKERLLNGGLNLVTHDIRVTLLMTNTTADTDNDGDVFVADLGTLDEMDGANYVRKALTGKVVTKDDANDRAFMDADDVTWTALGAGTRQIQGVLVYRHVTNDADSPLIAWLEFASPVTGDGTDFQVQWSATGIVLAS